VALTIAGSDSGGGAGIQADLKTFHAFGVFGTSAVTAITAQDTRRVHGVHAVPAAMVRAQIDAVVDDLAPAAVKSGMLATAGLVEIVAGAIEDHGLTTYVLDPVMVASSGDRLLEREAEAAVARRLVPLAALVTPNTHEAAMLTGVRVETTDGLREAARVLVERGAGAALVKGGHLDGPDDGEVVDVLWDGARERVWRHPRVRTRHTHGTGCTLSAAVAAALARGLTLTDAVDAAVDYVARAIASAPGLGHGHGPVNHFVVPRLGGPVDDPTGD
jgi:hydroxymethylpyrimidine/phosphomethylpyrimidine kinase